MDPARPPYQIIDQQLRLGRRALITGLDRSLRLSEPMATGAIIAFQADARARHRIVLGTIASLTAFTALNRTSPFWMVPTAGHDQASVPLETQWLLASLSDGTCLMLAPLVGERRRWTLEIEHGRLSLHGSANDSAVIESQGPALFVAHGPDPYALMPQAAAALSSRMGYLLRTQKPRPPLSDTLGWCTFNAYYADISHDKIRASLGALRAAGIATRWLLIDGGWQASVRAGGNEEWLCAISADPRKFPGGLAQTIHMAKQEFGLSAVMVWHALLGLPGGVADGAVPGMAVTVKDRRQAPGIYAVQPTIDDWFGLRVSAPAARDAGVFFDALHGYLREQGTDWIKVDFQSTLEAICHGEGGRVAYDRAWRAALESSSAQRFAHGLINCMSCSSECLYLGRDSALVRTSDDYYPNRPEMHGLHLHTNAQMGMWFGEFIQPDWDMFQSSHPYAGFHAAGRALSGGPVVITDEPGRHDPALIRRLVLSDGRTLLADHPGKPSPDCLFSDPTRSSRVLKIFNRAGGAGVVGMFHANHAQHLPVETALASRDVPGMADQEVVAFLHHAQMPVRLRPGQSIPIRLEHAGHETAVLAPVVDGLAVLGLGDRYCASAALHDQADAQGTYRARTAGGGPLLAWSERRPRRVTIDGQTVDWRWDERTGLGWIALDERPHAMEIQR